MGKGRYEYDGLKIHRIYSRILVKIYILNKNYFRPKFYLKFDKSSEPAEFSKRREVCNSAKWSQYNTYEMGKEISKIFAKKLAFGQKTP